MLSPSSVLILQLHGLSCIPRKTSRALALRGRPRFGPCALILIRDTYNSVVLRQPHKNSERVQQHLLSRQTWGCRKAAVPGQQGRGAAQGQEPQGLTLVPSCSRAYSPQQTGCSILHSLSRIQHHSLATVDHKDVVSHLNIKARRVLKQVRREG